jgi:hypothetical protein
MIFLSVFLLLQHGAFGLHKTPSLKKCASKWLYTDRGDDWQGG